MSPDGQHAGPGLSARHIQSFVRDGFVRLDGAFPAALADEGRAILWRDTRCDPDDSSTWTKPVIRLGLYGQEPFRRAAQTTPLLRALDQLVGKGRWLPRVNLGTFRPFPGSRRPAPSGNAAALHGSATADARGAIHAGEA